VPTSATAVRMSASARRAGAASTIVATRRVARSRSTRAVAAIARPRISAAIRRAAHNGLVHIELRTPSTISPTAVSTTAVAARSRSTRSVSTRFRRTCTARFSGTRRSATPVAAAATTFGRRARLATRGATVRGRREWPESVATRAPTGRTCSTLARIRTSRVQTGRPRCAARRRKRSRARR
jgi:hypothetical protein